MATRRKATKKKAPRKAPRRKVASRKSDTKKPSPPGIRGPGGKRGMTPFVATDEQRKLVSTLSGLHLTFKEISTVIENPRTGKGISVNTLQEHFEKELEQGQAKLKALVVGSLAKKAVSTDHPQSAICAMFIAKCRYGWRQEDKLVHEIDPASVGVLVAPGMRTPEEWIKSEEAANAVKPRPQIDDND